jgi:ATP-dependent helicase/nuclease subunit A
MAASPLGRRMAAAAARGDLFREQPFVLGVPARELKEEWPEDEQVIVQGIVDAFFIEEDRIILQEKDFR